MRWRNIYIPCMSKSTQLTIISVRIKLRYTYINPPKNNYQYKEFYSGMK